MSRAALPIALALALLVPAVAGGVVLHGHYRGEGVKADKVSSISFFVHDGYVHKLRFKASWKCRHLVRSLGEAGPLPRIKLRNRYQFRYKKVRKATRRGTTREVGLLVHGFLNGNTASGQVRQYWTAPTPKGQGRCDTGWQAWTAEVERR
jgi:hypothetical protein